MQEEEPAEWTIQEIEEYIRTIGRFNSVQINYMLGQNDAASSAHTRTAVPPDLPDLPDPLDPSDFPDPYQRSVSKEPGQPAREQSFSKELINLAKIYTDKSRYNGENDNFDYKLVIFHNLYSRVDIPDNIKAKAYPTILQSLALDHYYTSIKGAIQTYSLSFEQICNSTRNYFKGPEYKCGVLGQ